MSLHRLRKFLLYSTIINYALLIVWFILYKLPHEWMYSLSTPSPVAETPFGGLASVPLAVFDGYMLLGIIIYKVLVIFFNLIPFIILTFMARDEKAS